LADLFLDEDYRLNLRFSRGEAAEFFGPTERNAALVAERRRWLRDEPDTYAALLPEGEPLVAESVELARTWHQFAPRAGASWEQCLALGGWWEPDYLVMKCGHDGEIRLCGGCLCFPSSWRLGDKMGKTIEIIHDPVPGLNASIGPAIHKFLAGLKPGIAWLRHNWGLARNAELNHHPDRALPQLDASVRLEEVFVRVEHQALVALPKSGGILFGIRVVNHPLAEVRADPVARARLRRALETMPQAMAVYKGIASARETILVMLSG
jgi:hypothetical protein